jgi:hypothetical protein
MQLATMAGLDTVQFSGLIIAAAGITPTMTLILLHASTPGTVLGSKILFPQRNYTFLQDRGVMLISLSILLCILQPIGSYFIGHATLNFVNSTILYTMAACLQGLAMIYKESRLPTWSAAPLDIHFLSLCLFIMQTILTMIISPFIYTMQDLTRQNVGFPMMSYERNFHDGLTCLFGDDPDIPSHRHPLYDHKYATCEDINIWLIVAYVFSNIAIVECVDLILKNRQKSLSRSMIVGVFVAFVALTIYDTKADYGIGLYGSNVGFIDIFALVVLMIGMEVFGRAEVIIDTINTGSSVNQHISNIASTANRDQSNEILRQ